MHLSRNLLSLLAFTMLLISCSTSGPEDQKFDNFSFKGKILGNEYSLTPDNNAADGENWQYGYTTESSSFKILFSENELDGILDGIFIHTKKLDFNDKDSLDELLNVGYRDLGEIEYDFVLGVNEYLPESSTSTSYSTKGPQDDSEFYISNVEKYEIKGEGLFGYKITANIAATKLYDVFSNEYIGEIDSAEFIFGLVFPTNKYK